MKKFSRAPVRPQKELQTETELWQPDWSCFCCHDTGIIVPNLASLIISDYDPDRDKLPRCTQPGCRSGSHYDSEAIRATTDYRIDAATCQELDSLERENWRTTLLAQSKRIQDAALALAKEKSLRQRDRTPDESATAQEQHRLVVEEDRGLVAKEVE